GGGALPGATGQDRPGGGRAPGQARTRAQPVGTSEGEDACHGEAEHRGAARSFQGDDADRALRVREAVRGDLRRDRRGAGCGGGGKKVQGIKGVRELTGLGLKEAKDLVEGAPNPVLEKVNKETADQAKEKLEAQGAKVTLK